MIVLSPKFTKLYKAMEELLLKVITVDKNLERRYMGIDLLMDGYKNFGSFYKKIKKERKSKVKTQVNLIICKWWWNRTSILTRLF